MAKETNIISFKTEVLDAPGRVLVDFYADWCGPCKMMSPVLEQLAAIKSDITVLKCNVDANISLAQRFGISSIPALLVFEGGQVKKSIIGFHTLDELLGIL